MEKVVKRRVFRLSIALICVVLLVVILLKSRGVGAGLQDDTDEKILPDTVKTQYAKGFTILKYPNNIRLVTVKNPWQGAKNVEFSYVLAPASEEVPDFLSHYPRITTPINKVICCSSTHVAMVKALKKEDTIVGISGAEYVSDSTIYTRFKEGEIKEIGYGDALDYETIIKLNPDVILTYGINSNSPNFEKLTELNQMLVLNAEYLENHPLAKAEWLKFVAQFYDEEEAADSIFANVEKQYIDLVEFANTAKTRPVVFASLPYQGVWYVPGAESVTAKFINDAGANYLFASVKSQDTKPFEIEAVIAIAQKADFWINTGTARSMDDVVKTDSRLRLLSAFKTAKMYNNYARVGQGGGNDYFESGVLNPHLILRDLIAILHPELLPNQQLEYYFKLK